MYIEISQTAIDLLCSFSGTKKKKKKTFAIEICLLRHLSVP